MYETKSFEELAEAEILRWEKDGRHIPSQDEIDTIAAVLIDYKEKHGVNAALENIYIPPGIVATKFPEEGMLIYWGGDPIIKELLVVDVIDLPKFLACADSGIRKLAKDKLDFLEKEE